MVPKSYSCEITKGCAKCKKCHITVHADYTKYYCNSDSSTIPEDAAERSGHIRPHLAVSWFKWSMPRAVAPWGVCNEFESID